MEGSTTARVARYVARGGRGIRFLDCVIGGVGLLPRAVSGTVPRDDEEKSPRLYKAAGFRRRIGGADHDAPQACLSRMK